MKRKSMSRNFFYIAQFFTPEPYLKDIDFIKNIREKGWNPVVITSFPNYPKGKIYAGYKNKFFAEETMDGIQVVRVFTYADHSLNSMKRALNYFIFGFFSALAVLKYGKRNSFYYILQSSPFVIFCAWAIKVFKPKSKILLDIQDVFPENIRVSGFINSKVMINILDFLLNHFYYKTFDLFVTVSESFRKIVASKNISPDRILTLYNWSMIESHPTIITPSYQFEDNGFHIVYAGNIGVHQGLSKLSSAINNITEKNHQIFFHFFGDGTDFKLLKKKVGHNKNVILHGRVSENEIGKYLQAADALFLHLIKDPIYESIIPSKLQAYIGIGKPLLAGIEGEARAFVTEAQLGEVFHSEDNTGFEEAALKLIQYSQEIVVRIRKNSLNLYAEKFSRAAGTERLNTYIIKNTK
ncbi:glycosyltransferase WbuB [Chryseobacterium lacus]|uniref:Glycosyltransferase WbuB n=2 Tax=Chryseobacterium lacus TaxID=2058346 RepID=A0A368MZZ8_9FLAO|nr:glycosyltransferase WbuB [Chryseobacterium lacus]RST27824.1 glycosyltransferase WbuB [Chryseobacterium lacus]